MSCYEFLSLFVCVIDSWRLAFWWGKLQVKMWSLMDLKTWWTCGPRSEFVSCEMMNQNLAPDGVGHVTICSLIALSIVVLCWSAASSGASAATNYVIRNGHKVFHSQAQFRINSIIINIIILDANNGYCQSTSTLLPLTWFCLSSQIPSSVPMKRSERNIGSDGGRCSSIPLLLIESNINQVACAA